MGTESAIYKIILLLHVLTAIVGFGGIIAHSAYNAKAFRSKASDAAVLLRTTIGVGKLAEYGIYAVFVLGIVLISLSDGAIGFGEAWISASFVVIFAVVGLLHGLVRPAIKGMTARAEALAPDAELSGDGEAMALAKKLALGEGATQLLLAVALYLMIWQPGA